MKKGYGTLLLPYHLQDFIYLQQLEQSSSTWTPLIPTDFLISTIIWINNNNENNEDESNGKNNDDGYDKS